MEDKKKEVFNEVLVKYEGKINWDKMDLLKTTLYKKLKGVNENILAKLSSHTIDEEMIEFFWKNKSLTKEIAPEIIEDFGENVKIDEGRVYIVVSLSLVPFFRDNFEENFQELRLKDDWEKCIDFDKTGKGPLCTNGIFTYDEKEDEREIEKVCYDIKAFRGITYNELLTPIYTFNKGEITNIFDEIKERINEKIDINVKAEFLKKCFEKIKQDIVESCWNIKIRITKGGLVNVFFEKNFKNVDINIFAEEKRKLIRSPYSEFENDVQVKRFIEKNKLLKKEQVFTSYLNAAAIWITHIFLKCNYEKIAKILKIKEGKKWTDCLEDPWNVMYKASPTKDASIYNAPPLRNYCVVFHFKNVKGIKWGEKIIPAEKHFDCPADIATCKKREGDNCFITLFGHSLLALLTNTYIVNDGQRRLIPPKFTKRELENFAKRDLSRWRGELCFIDSETILICTPSNIEYINKEGHKVKYDEYWKSIIKGFSLLVSCKTLAMDISRQLFDCIQQHRNKPKEAEKILKRLNIISHLLSRVRFIATPSNISRARYVREKLEVYIKAIGLPEIINNIEKDYDELNKAIHASIESKRTEQIKNLTFLLVPLTFVTVFGTLILALIELDRFNDIVCIINTIKNNWFLICFAFLVSLFSILILGIFLLKVFSKFIKEISKFLS